MSLNFGAPWEPLPHQERALTFALENPRAALFLDPGLGKTSVMLAAVKMLQRPALVVAPLRVCHNVWPREVTKWRDFLGMRVSKVVGTSKQRMRALEEEADLYAINPENFVWLTELIQKGDWSPPPILIVDESTKFKNPTSKRFRALKKLLGAGHFPRRYILTGTPAPNGYEDLFSQIFILDDGDRLGRYITHYRMKYFIQDWNGFDWTLRPGAEEIIQEKIADVALTMRAEEYLDLEPVTVNQIRVDLPPRARTIYDELEREFMSLVDGQPVLAFKTGSVGMKLRQVANGRVYSSAPGGGVVDIHEAKLEALEELHKELGERPLLVAYEFVHDAEAIQRRFKCPIVGGGVASSTANAILLAWNAQRLPMLAIHPASGGHGLNLQTGGNHLVFYGTTWDLELHDQMIARLWRQGQEERVCVHYILANDTMDDRVVSVLTSKSRTQRDLMAALSRPKEAAE